MTEQLPKDLVAVATPEGRLCVACAQKFIEKYGHPADEHTPVLRSDDWKHEISGPCDSCEEWVALGDD